MIKAARWQGVSGLIMKDEFQWLVNIENEISGKLQLLCVICLKGGCGAKWYYTQK